MGRGAETMQFRETALKSIQQRNGASRPVQIAGKPARTHRHTDLDRVLDAQFSIKPRHQRHDEDRIRRRHETPGNALDQASGM